MQSTRNLFPHTNTRVRFALAVLALAALAGFVVHLRGRTYGRADDSRAAGERTQDSRQRMAEAYGRLPLSFEVNKGQTDGRVEFLSRGAGYSLFLTKGEAVLSLSKGNRGTGGEAEELKARALSKSSVAAGVTEHAVLRMKMLGANPDPAVSGEQDLPGKSNYFIGRDPQQWQKDVSNFARVRYQGIYRGVDLVYYGNQQQLEYDFVLSPGASPEAIALSFEGADGVLVDDDGSLLLGMGGAEIRQHKPFAYQDVEGVRQQVACGYVIDDKQRVKFQVGSYDTSRPLIIDPVLVYSTYFGGSNFEQSDGIAVDAGGNAYITGYTASINFPGTALQNADHSPNAFVTKINAAGTSVIYSSYFGGTGSDVAYGIALDPDGNAYVTGSTYSGDFPVTSGSFQPNLAGGTSTFYVSANGGQSWAASSGTSGTTVSVIRPHPTDPSIVFLGTFSNGVFKSTDGGATWNSISNTQTSFHNNDLVVDPNNPNNLIASNSSAVGVSPVFWSADAGQTWNTPTGLLPNNNYTESLALDPNNPGTVYVAYGSNGGVYKSTDMGHTWASANGAIAGMQLPTSGNTAGINGLAVDPNTSAVYAATFSGVYKSTDGGGTWTLGPSSPVLDDADGEIIVVDNTTNPSTIYLAAAGKVYKSTDGLSWTQLNTSFRPNTLALDKSTTPATLYVGSTGSGVYKSTDGGVNWTQSGLSDSVVYALLPESRTSPAKLYAGTYAGSDAFVTKLSSDGSALLYSTYLGGGASTAPNSIPDDLGFSIALDSSRNAYVTGTSRGGAFPTRNARQPVFGGGFNDAFISKLNAAGTDLVYSTYVGGSSQDIARSIAVDASGSAYIAGYTISADDPNTASVNEGFPTKNAIQPANASPGNFDAFVTKMNPSGSDFTYSTYLGGGNADQGFGIAVDPAGNAYVTGLTNSDNLPVVNAYQSTRGTGGNSAVDSFVGKLNASGTSYGYLTYLGGSNNDRSYAVAADASGNAYVVGYTNSTNFPTRNPIQAAFGGGTFDAYVAIYGPTGSQLNSTYVGGAANDQGLGIAVDPQGGVYVTGISASTEVKTGAIQSTNGGNTDAFIMKFATVNDLAVTMTDSPDPVSANSNLTYTVTLTNSGDWNLTGVNLSDALPANTTFVSATSTQGTCSGTSTVNCNVGNMNIGQSVTVTIVVKPTQTGSLSNTVSATATESEANTGNNSALQTTSVIAGTGYTVNSTADTSDGTCDSNNCTLREAILAANSHAGPDTILFNIAGGGPQTINATPGFPTISEAVFIDGASQPGFNGQPIINVNGAGAGQVNGFWVAGGGTRIKGLVINGFFYSAINLQGNNNVVEGCYIGTNLAGTGAVPNGGGINVENGSNTVIGGLTPGARNVISGNNGNGISVSANATGTKIQGNYIGTNAAGSAGLPQPNWAPGVGLYSTSGTTVGGTEPGAGNVISGNKGTGVYITNTWPGGTPGSSNNFVQGNLIGTDATGQVAIGNQGGNVQLSAGSSNNLIGGNTAAARNVLVKGRLDINGGATLNLVQGNYIGLFKNGTPQPQPADWLPGVAINSASANTIGGTGPGEGNVISGNSGPGIWLANSGPNTAGATNNVVQGNFIGTTPNGLSAAPNNGGISIGNGSSGNIIGGAGASARNVISGNSGQGININNSDGASNNNTIQGNYIGLKADGSGALSNSSQGMGVYGASGTQIVGNTISGNSGGGIHLFGASPAQGQPAVATTNTSVRGNFIGTDPTGTFAIPNSGGVNMGTFATNNTIGGPNPADRNVISGNNGDGVNLGTSNGAASGNTVQGNYIGVNAAGTAKLANTGAGIGLFGVANTNILGNVISGNNSNGISLGTGTVSQGGPSVGATGSIIQGNLIGTNATGTAAIPNVSNGVNLFGAANNQIGGAGTARNIISGNTQAGISFGVAGTEPAVLLPDGNLVKNNYIGTSATGTAAIPNSNGGIQLGGSSNNTIEGNVVSGNTGQGISLNYNRFTNAQNVVTVDRDAANNLIRGNFIGTNAVGTAALPNTLNGVVISGASNNTIGGPTTAERNVISGNGQAGVSMGVITLPNNVWRQADGNKVLGNYVGVGSDGATQLGNGNGINPGNGQPFNSGGINLSAVTNMQIVGNVVSGNRGNGLNLANNFLPFNAPTTIGESTGNTIQGNLIGVKADGTTALGNIGQGVNISGSSNTVGGMQAGAGNTIANNTGIGVVLFCQSFGSPVTLAKCGVMNNILSNSIYSNGGQGIVFGTGPAPANPSTANANQANPTLVYAGPAGVSGSLSGTTANTVFRVEFFSNDACDPTGSGEGQSFLGSTQVTTGVSGSASFTATSLAPFAQGKFITATATGPNGTSRFSQCLIGAAATANLNGRATDSNGNPLAGVLVTLTGGQSASATTDANGNYSFQNLPSDQSYTVAASVSGVSFYPSGFTLPALPRDRTVNFTKAVQRYTLTDLGVLASNSTQSTGWDVNEAGTVAGWANTGPNAVLRPFVYSGGLLTSLGTIQNGNAALAIAINSNGRVVGYSDIPNVSNARGFFYDGSGAMKEIGTLGGTAAQAWGVNDSGHIVGQSQISGNTQTVPFLWRDANNDGLWQQSETISLGQLGGTFGRAFAISNNGVVVGNSQNGAGGAQVATLWKDENNNGQADAGELRSLGNLGGPNTLASQAQGINDSGYVTGVSQIAALSTNGRQMERAFLWHDDNGNGQADAGEMKDLGTLGGEFSAILRINTSGEAVGYSDVVGISTAHAAVYRNNHLLDLNALIQQNSGWTLTEARGISDDGKITGYGTFNGQQRAYLLTPLAKTPQTVSFNNPPATKVYGNAPFQISATASSGLPVTYSVSGPATVNGNNITITGAGNIIVTATQEGDGTYDSASATHTITVAKKPLTVTADGKTRFYGAPDPQFTVSYFGFVNGDSAGALSGTLGFTTNATVNSPVGSYAITPGGLSSNNYQITFNTGTLTVAKAGTTTASADYSLGAPGPVTLAAAVTANSPSTKVVSEGAVTFTVRQGSTTVATIADVPVVNGLAQASYNAAAGAYMVYMSYVNAPSGNFSGSTTLASLTVGSNALAVPGTDSVSSLPADQTPQPSVVAGSSQFTLTVRGSSFLNTSVVQWFDPDTATTTQLQTTYGASDRLTAIVPAGLLTTARTIEVRVNTPAPQGYTGGGLSNMQPFFITGANSDAVVTAADTAISDPITGTATASTESASGSILSAEASTSGGTSGSGTLTVAEYAADPVGVPSTGNSATSTFSSAGEFFDVHVSSDSSFNQLTLNYCNSGGTTLYWWNGTGWGLVNPQSYNPATQCISITVSNTSSPSIADLTGTVFGVADGPEVRQVSVNPTGPVARGNSVGVSASFIDQGGLDGDVYSATVEWGDGTSSPGALTAPAGSQPGTVTGTHAYPNIGVYRVKVTVNRQRGGETAYGSKSYEYVVVYDPNVGSVTGGGWVNSPAGSFTLNRSFAGKATFGFNSKYEGGVPRGETQFTVTGGGLAFHGSVYRWFVVAGATAQYEGTGTVNGKGSYGFKVTALDGQATGGGGVDKFRIKIWDSATGAVIYDNQMGSGDDAAPTALVGGGQITIQK